MNTAVVLAAGHGTRAWPYAGVRQKVTLPICNVPLIRRLVQQLLSLGLKEIVVVVGHRAAAVRGCVADLPGVRFVEQRVPTGTAEATMAALQTIREEHVLVCHGDLVLTRDDLAQAIQEFQTRDAQALTLVTRTLPMAMHWITVEATKPGLADRIYPRGEKQLPKYVGVTAAKRALLEKYLLRNPGIAWNAPEGAMPPPEGDLTHSLDLMLADGVEVHTAATKGFVVDVDKPWQYVEANHRAVHDMFARIETNSIGEGASISDSAEIADDAKLVLGPGAKIGQGVLVKGSLILEAGARIDHHAVTYPDVLIGPRSVCEYYGGVGTCSVIGPNCYFGHGMDFIGIACDTVCMRHAAQMCAVLGSHVSIAGGVMTGNWRFDDGATTFNIKGCRETPANYGEMTYVGDFCRLGNNVVTTPGTRIGAYSCIAPLIYLSEDVPDNSLIIQKQEIIRKEWGSSRYGW